MNFKIENWKLLVLSIFYLIFSVLSYSISKEQYLNFFMIAGIIVALVGLFQILVYFFKKDYLKPNEFSFSFGVLYLLAGVIVACKPSVIVDNRIKWFGCLRQYVAFTIFHEFIPPARCTMEGELRICYCTFAHWYGFDLSEHGG